MDWEDWEVGTWHRGPVSQSVRAISGGAATVHSIQSALRPVRIAGAGAAVRAI
ncbi:unnamed protein product [Symbiodinium natans]|uniref:Uncharacterized protein n=1 Tax=Symbiodinium natans TaxID=878477 RepID=A0A812Q5V3_9DINO|nr:unnamed protein product [Symbiodinium natans]